VCREVINLQARELACGYPQKYANTKAFGSVADKISNDLRFVRCSALHAANGQVNCWAPASATADNSRPLDLRPQTTSITGSVFDQPINQHPFGARQWSVLQNR